VIQVRFRYSTTHPSQNEFDSLPRISLLLHHDNQQIEVIGLVDSGATVSVLPYNVGLQLGGTWDERRATIQLAGNLGKQPAIPIFVMSQVGEYQPVRLAFAWVQDDRVPLILGQMNFFLEFDICFYRSIAEFEVRPKLNG
jgi:hypothetical protein